MCFWTTFASPFNRGCTWQKYPASKLLTQIFTCSRLKETNQASIGACESRHTARRDGKHKAPPRSCRCSRSCGWSPRMAWRRTSRAEWKGQAAAQRWRTIGCTAQRIFPLGRPGSLDCFVVPTPERHPKPREAFRVKRTSHLTQQKTHRKNCRKNGVFCQKRADFGGGK